jgi:hypothetical protein
MLLLLFIESLEGEDDILICTIRHLFTLIKDLLNVVISVSQ